MGVLHKSTASMDFYGDELDPAEITRALGAEPTVGVRKRSLWQTKPDAEKVASRESWHMKAERFEPGDLYGQIKDLLDGLSDAFELGNRWPRNIAGGFSAGYFSPAAMKV